MRYYAQFMDLTKGQDGFNQQIEANSISTLKKKLSKYSSISTAFIYDRENEGRDSVATYKPYYHQRKN